MQLMIRDQDEGALLAFVKENSGSSTATNTDGWTALHEAAYFGVLGCVMILIESKTSVLPINQTALLLAAYRGHVSCVEYLLEHGADPNICNKEREGPLFRACENKSLRMVELLLRCGASVNKTDNQGATPFHEAVRTDQLEVCEILFQAGAKISTFNIYGNRPFFTAAQGGCSNVLGFLLAKGADINKQARDGATPLYEACKNDHLCTVEILLSHKADVNLPTKSGLLPIHQATQRANKQMVSMLLPLTSKKMVSSSGISPLHLAAEDGLDDILELLIRDGYDVNSQLSREHRLMYEDHRSTALYFSVCDDNLEAATILLEAGADPNLDFFNPLLIAVQKGNAELVELLLMYGHVHASLSTHKLGFPSAVLLAMNSINVLKLLLDHGCDVHPCFDCDYAGTNSRHDQNLTQTVILFQFCEAISKYSIKEPGPLISLLLDYVGHIKLCSRLLEILDGCNDRKHIKSKAGTRDHHSSLFITHYDYKTTTDRQGRHRDTR
uniref:Ankyrin repeat and SOCS box containing 2a, tandem duplicate 2 n=1 Tax=Gadus morhua TaxID=8049 RepID=A0A8C4ZA80_GADMO